MDKEEIILGIVNGVKGDLLGVISDFKSDIKGDLNKINEKVDQLVIKEAERKGWIKGIKRSTIILTTVISLCISLAGVAIALYGG